MSGSHILGTLGPIISFPNNLTKKYFYSKVRLVSETARSDLFKEPIKSYCYCKNALELIRSVTSGPKCQVHYTYVMHTN